MNPEIKTRFLAALRSGKYKQGKGWLRTCDDSYCVMGVLCDIVDPSAWNEAVVLYGHHKVMQHRNHTGVPCDSVLAVKESSDFKIRFTEDEILADPRLQAMRTMSGGLAMKSFTITGLNDVGYSFNELADLIEHRLQAAQPQLEEAGH